MYMSWQILEGDCRLALQTLPADHFHTCVTSPPYFGLRDYGHDGQIGLEQTPEAFVQELVTVFREVRRVLRDDGTLWLNLGDSYGKAKQLLGIPWRVAFALQADGWYLRQDIIWHKRNPMPESVRDRCTKAHEYIFLLAKSSRYYFDSEAIKEPAVDPETIKGKRPRRSDHIQADKGYDGHRTRVSLMNGQAPRLTRNRRSVWSVATKPFKGAHFATFPPDLIEPCILAGCPAGGHVIDPFNGAGTTGLVSIQHGRNYTGIELNPDYIALANDRLTSVQTLRKP